MITFTYRPLVWTGPRTPVEQRRSRWTFKASWQDTLTKLDTELYYLDASAAVIEADFRERDIRRDGLPRGDARQPDFPGVKISFNTPHLGRLQYETDTHEFWQHNVRGIALGLEALRAVDRYGITSGQQQYTGFRAIGAGATAMPPRPMSRQDAAQFIATHADPVGGGRPAIVEQLLAGNLAAYKPAARRLHPDAGGSTELFQRLQEARRVLDA